MFRSLLTLPLLALIAVLPFVETLVAQQPKTGVNYAFLVSPAEYDKNELKPLPFSATETEEFRQALLKTGFEERNVKFLHDKAERRYLPEKAKIVTEFKLLLARVKPEDTVVVLLNGHGVQYSGDKFGYFCPVDAKLTDKKTLWAMDGPGGVYDLLKGCKAKRKVLLANACRNDPRSDLSLAGDKIEIVDEYAEAVPEGIAALYSCAAGEKCYYYDPTDPKTKDRKRSLFMHHLIEAWGQEKTTIEEVFRKVRVNASADADDLFGRKQNPIPRREYKGEGEWTIRANVAAVAPPAERSRPKEATPVPAKEPAEKVEVTHLTGGFADADASRRHLVHGLVKAGTTGTVTAKDETTTMVQIQLDGGSRVWIHQDCCKPAKN